MERPAHTVRSAAPLGGFQGGHHVDHREAHAEFRGAL